MKSGIFCFVAAMAAASLVGCTSVNTSDAANRAKIEIVSKYEAVYDHKTEKVGGEAKVHNLFGIFSWGVSETADYSFVSDNMFSFFPLPEQLAKQGASYNACTSAKADALLGAHYELKTTNYFVYKVIDCKVVGFPAMLKDVKNIPCK